MIVWRCKECSTQVEFHYNHVGKCDRTSTTKDCTGTFNHIFRANCSLRGRELNHDQVRADNR